MDTDDRIEQCYGIQPNGKPNRDDDIYVNSDKYIKWMYSYRPSSCNSKYGSTDGECRYWLYEDMYDESEWGPNRYDSGSRCYILMVTDDRFE